MRTLTLTERLVEAVTAAAISPEPLGKCEHMKTGDPFTCFILHVPALPLRSGEYPQRLCAECTRRPECIGPCTVCGNDLDGEATFITLTFERSSGKDARDKFIAPLCGGCGQGVPEGMVGTFLELAKTEDGRTVFLAYKRSATKEKVS